MSDLETIKMQNVELRHVSVADMQPIIRALRDNDSWKRLMASIPEDLRDETDNFKSKYSTEHMDIIQNAADKQNRPHAEILLEEWSTSGRFRPRIKDLIKILMKAELYRAADEASQNLLKAGKVPRPAKGPAAAVNVSLTQNLPSRMNNVNNNSTENNLERNLVKREVIDDKKVLSLLMTNDTSAATEVTDLPNSNDTEDGNSDARNTEITNLSDSNNQKQIVDIMNSDDIENKVLNTSDIPAFNTLLKVSTEDSNSLYVIEQSQSEYISSKKIDLIPASLPDFSNLEEEEFRSESTVQSYNIPDLALINSDREIPNDFSKSVSSLQKFQYSRLEECTDGFNDQQYVKGDEKSGCKIGTGASGSVYLAQGLFGYPVAVKRLTCNTRDYTQEILKNQFTSEITHLTNYQHENILLLLGYSDDGPMDCLVYEYLDGGTLQENIKLSHDFFVLARMEVALGIARGIEYLHYGYRTSLIHRDIKSANILLTTSRVPKLCDFGLIKEISSESMTSKVYGTDTYMSPEAFRGNISPKMDVYSYGVVLLELLTGLPPRDKHSKIDIITHIEEACPHDDITPLVDERAGPWNHSRELYDIIKQCLIIDKKQRPTIVTIIELLVPLVNSLS